MPLVRGRGSPPCSKLGSTESTNANLSLQTKCAILGLSVTISEQVNDRRHSVSRWAVHDRYGNEIYMTRERWDYILPSLSR